MTSLFLLRRFGHCLFTIFFLLFQVDAAFPVKTRDSNVLIQQHQRRAQVLSPQVTLPSPHSANNRVLGVMLSYDFGHIDPLVLILHEYVSMCEGMNYNALHHSNNVFTYFQLVGTLSYT
jgi:hypothetical protein